MKKYLILLSVAALALASCAKVKDVYTGSPESREIAFSPLAQPATKAAISDGVFPTSSKMYVAAYDATAGASLFDATEFSYSSGTLWTGGKSWPLSPARINFLAYAEFQGETASWGTPNASGVTLTMTDNRTAQKDLIYAIGSGSVTQNANSTLQFPDYVSMTFQHAQAWITFNANATESSSNKVTVNYIKLNGASYSGTFAVSVSNYNTNSPSVSGSWTSVGDAPGDGATITGPNSAISYAATGNGTAIGNGLLIVPKPAESDFTSFTINYTLAGKTYDYTYTPESTAVVAGSKYTYNIVFSLHDIAISAGVSSWTTPTGINVSL